MYIDTEGMQRAANTMRAAAERMQDACNSLDSINYRHERFMDDWLYRLEQTLDANNGRHVILYDGVTGYSKGDGGSTI